MGDYNSDLLSLRSKASKARVELACGCYTEALHAFMTIRQHLSKGLDRSALRCMRPMVESSLRTLYAAHVSDDKAIKRSSFPKSLTRLAEDIEGKATYFAPMFTGQLSRVDAHGYTVDRLVNGWAHSDVKLIRPYCKPGSLEPSPAFLTAKNFLAFAQAACFALDPTLTPAAPYSTKYY